MVCSGEPRGKSGAENRGTPLPDSYFPASSDLGGVGLDCQVVGAIEHEVPQEAPVPQEDAVPEVPQQGALDAGAGAAPASAVSRREPATSPARTMRSAGIAS